ncbi:hypothetical protein PoB_006161300 [Plakobranchus ocellatus]|uniref:Uncharacterized protein n=1 Tax=Plakobranchus ocellatus TaxID=259542 RepID=A0AAV4CTD8_9GAST|nr:hypothetical protein PoB_006161300 [Plakobranchus ocellatus]
MVTPISVLARGVYRYNGNVLACQKATRLSKTEFQGIKAEVGCHRVAGVRFDGSKYFTDKEKQRMIVLTEERLGDDSNDEPRQEDKASGTIGLI